jgi:alanine racemase
VAKSLAGAGVDSFGVTCSEEGAELRAAGIHKPILVLTGFWPGEERRQLEAGLTPTISDLEQLPHLERAAARMLRNAKHRNGRRTNAAIPFHLKFDTGMNRLGVPPRDLPQFVRLFADCRHLRLEGTFTHFAAAEDFTSQQTAEQQRIFTAALDQLRAAGIAPGIVHLANSAATAARPDTWADMVRPGALLYGYHQAYDPPERRDAMRQQLPLRPALSLRARVVSVKDVPGGQGVGYNSQFVTQRASRIAVVAAGYAEGVVRLLTNRGRVIVRGRCAPLVGIISMDLSMVDVTDLPQVRPGDIATVFGGEPGAPCALDASNVARELGTVTSDLLCAIGKRVARIYRQ